MNRAGRSVRGDPKEDEILPARFAETLLRAPLPLGPVHRAALRRFLQGAPEAVTLAGKGVRTAAGVRKHLGYISRYGELPLWDEAGLRRQGRQDAADLARDWAYAERLDSLRRAGGVMARPLTLTAPPGSDPMAVRQATAAFLRETYKYDYVYAFHTDRPHPHAHVLFRSLAPDGARLIWSPEDLQRDRGRFAAFLRAQGIEVQATPRRLRHQPGRSAPPRLWRISQRLRAAQQMELKTFRALVREAAQIARTPSEMDPEREARVEQARQRTQDELSALSQRLASSPNAVDRELADDLRAYVAHAPEMMTERSRLARQLKDRLVRSELETAPRRLKRTVKTPELAPSRGD